jgi:hypothetical protein
MYLTVVDRGLQNVGVKVDESMTETYLDALEDLYIGEGFYRDSNEAKDSRRIDWVRISWVQHQVMHSLIIPNYFSIIRGHCTYMACFTLLTAHRMEREHLDSRNEHENSRRISSTGLQILGRMCRMVVL